MFWIMNIQSDNKNILKINENTAYEKKQDL